MLHASCMRVAVCSVLLKDWQSAFHIHRQGVRTTCLFARSDPVVWLMIWQIIVMIIFYSLMVWWPNGKPLILTFWLNFILWFICARMGGVLNSTVFPCHPAVWSLILLAITGSGTRSPETRGRGPSHYVWLCLTGPRLFARRSICLQQVLCLLYHGQ